MVKVCFCSLYVTFMIESHIYSVVFLFILCQGQTSFYGAEPDVGQMEARTLTTELLRSIKVLDHRNVRKSLSVFVSGIPISVSMFG